MTKGFIFNFSKSTFSYLIFNYKFDARYQLNCSRIVFIKRFNVFLAKQERFWNFYAFLKIEEAEKFFPDKPSKNIQNLSFTILSVHIKQNGAGPLSPEIE